MRSSVGPPLQMAGRVHEPGEFYRLWNAKIAGGCMIVLSGARESLMPGPHWPRASEWLAGSIAEPIGSVAILGAPANLGSVAPGTCDEAPDAIRTALGRFSSYDLE